MNIREVIKASVSRTNPQGCKTTMTNRKQIYSRPNDKLENKYVDLPQQTLLPK